MEENVTTALLKVNVVDALPAIPIPVIVLVFAAACKTGRPTPIKTLQSKTSFFLWFMAKAIAGNLLVATAYVICVFMFCIRSFSSSFASTFRLPLQEISLGSSFDLRSILSMT